MTFQTTYNVRNDLKDLSVEEIRSVRSTKNFAVATFNLKGDLNLGSIMRTAELTGAKEFFIFGHRGWDRRSAVGVHNYIPVERIDNVTCYQQAAVFLALQGDYLPVVVEHKGKPMDEFFEIIRPTRLKPCFIFGPEEGFSSDWHPTIELKQMGVSRSYNVASAAAIILYNWSFGK